MKTKEFINQVKEIFTLKKRERLYFFRIFTTIFLIHMVYMGISAIGEPIINSHYTAKGMFTGILMTVLLCISSYFSRLPNENEKPLKYWAKLLKLKLQISILKKNLKPYTTLNSIKHRKYKLTRKTVKDWRFKLKELESNKSKLNR